MTGNDIRRWRPRRWVQFLGAANAPAIRRLQQAAICKVPPPPIMLIGPYGGVKTSLGCYLLRCFCCSQLNLATGDPCNDCDGCTRQGPPYNGEIHGFRHWEIDCTRISAGMLRDKLYQLEEQDDSAVFFDEFGKLSSPRDYNLILRFSERFRGLLIVAVTRDEYENLSPALCERFRPIWLARPEVEELVAFFARMTVEWGVRADEALIRTVVEETDCSFRTCLNVFAAGADNDPRVLDRATVEEFLSLPSGRALVANDRGDEDE